jgi:predicted transcriptional regulator
MGWVSDLLKDFPALSVAKERLALMEEKYKDLEKKYNRACEELERLKTKNSELRAKLLEFETPEETPEVSSELKNLLVYLFTHTNDRQVHPDAIAQALGVQTQMAKYYIDKLTEMKFVRIGGGNALHGWAFYRLTDKGRAFVVEKGLLSK